MDWLRNGPGKQTADGAGWTGPVRPDGLEGETSVLLDPEVQALLARMLEALGEHPEARVALARVIEPVLRTPAR
jgi:hypothetical protein